MIVITTAKKIIFVLNFYTGVRLFYICKFASLNITMSCACGVLELRIFDRVVHRHMHACAPCTKEVLWWTVIAIGGFVIGNLT